MKIGIIGCGKMGSALAEGLLRGGIAQPADVLVFDVVKPVAEALSARIGARLAGAVAEVVAASEVIVVCVKPADVSALLCSSQSELGGKLVVSIAAGIRIAALQSAAGEGARVVRVMPNTPALIGRGAAAYAPGESATGNDAALVERIFSAVGGIWRVKESAMDAVTALSGSGPAYVFLVVESLADAGVLMGLPREMALDLAARTVAGAAEMVLRTGQHPAQLRDAVTSPGGTTIAGLEALEKGGIRAAFMAAVRAAAKRSEELGAS